MRNGSRSEEPSVVCEGAVKAAPVSYLPLSQLGLSLNFVLLSTREKVHMQMKMEILYAFSWVTFTEKLKSQLGFWCVIVYMWTWITGLILKLVPVTTFWFVSWSNFRLHKPCLFRWNYTGRCSPWAHLKLIRDNYPAALDRCCSHVKVCNPILWALGHQH